MQEMIMTKLENTERTRSQMPKFDLMRSSTLKTPAYPLKSALKKTVITPPRESTRSTRNSSNKPLITISDADVTFGNNDFSSKCGSTVELINPSKANE